MRRFADPHHCPDCGATLPATGPVCPSCHLDLRGPLGQELFTTLTRADTLLVRLRELSAASGAPAPAATTVAEPVTTAAAPATPASPATSVATRLDTASVPKILLSLGALCLLVAALVFLAVSWSEMGVGGRTATLVAVTSVAGAVTAWCARRGLRGATEALGTVTLGLTTLDVVGARDAGWLGTPSTAGFAAVLGLVLVVLGAGAAAALRRTPAGGFTCGELVAAAGAACLSSGLVSGTWGDPVGRALVAVLVTGAIAAVVRRLAPLRVAVAGLVAVAAVDWLVLVVVALDRAGADPSVASVWPGLDGWGLVAAAAVAGAVAGLRTLPTGARVVALGGAAGALALLATLPAYDEPGTTLTLAVLAAVAVAAVATAAAPRPWAAAGLAVSGPGSLYLGVQLLALGVPVAERYATTAATAWAGATGDRLGDLVPERSQAAAWALPLLVVVLLGAAWSAVRLTPEGRRLGVGAGLLGGGWLVALSVAAALLLHPVPVWTVLVVVLATGVTAVLVGLRPTGGDDRSVPLVAGGATLAAAQPLSWYAPWLTLVALAVTTAAAVAVQLRSRTEPPALVAGLVVPALAAGMVWTAGELVGASGPATALAALVVLGGLAVARVPGGHRTAAPVELGSLVAGTVVAGAGIDTATSGTVADWAAVYLTAGGTAATLTALLRADRRPAGWLGGALLAAATWVRLADLGVEAPEPYTLPSAVALVVTGVFHLRRHPDSSTLTALSPGLALALVPSLLWVLDDPVSARAVLLGAACLGLLLAGVRLRWGAPIAHASVVGALLVLREAGPYVGGSVPRWALIGLAGALLLVLGTTWERRLQEARAVAGYLRRLR